MMYLTNCLTCAKKTSFKGIWSRRFFHGTHEAMQKPGLTICSASHRQPAVTTFGTLRVWRLVGLDDKN